MNLNKSFQLFSHCIEPLFGVAHIYYFITTYSISACFHFWFEVVKRFFSAVRSIGDKLFVSVILSVNPCVWFRC